MAHCSISRTTLSTSSSTLLYIGFEKKFEAIALHDSQMDAQTLAMYRVYFGMKGKELAAGKNFALGEGLKVLSPLHAHCFVDAARI